MLKSQLIPFLLRAGEESDPSDTGGVEAHGGTWMQVITCNFKRYVRGKYPATLHGTLRSATGGYTWHLCAGNALDIHILFTVLICPTSVSISSSANVPEYLGTWPLPLVMRMRRPSA